MFRVLPFGLSSAGFVFTKVVREIVKYWRSRSYPVVVYLDDGIAFVETCKGAEVIAEKIKSDLIESGFVPNVKKCEWVPSQRRKWLGFDIDLTSMRVYATNKKLEDIASSIYSVLAGVKKVTRRVLA